MGKFKQTTLKSSFFKTTLIDIVQTKKAELVTHDF